MCGIAGLAGRLATGDRHNVAELLRSAANTLSHRGPDGDGFWVSDHAAVGFAHRRLAIIDLSGGSRQPMVSADGQHALTFNGEIYNYEALRAELRGLGYTFRTEGDTEVLLAGCLIWGAAATARRARGMFAFAFTSLADRALWLCRDRFGEKPLYWSIWGGTLGFGSELKALRTFPGCPHSVDRGSVAEFMNYQAFSAPRTIYTDVWQLRPGTVLRVALSANIQPTDVDEHVYWDAIAEADSARSTPFTGSLDDAADELDVCLGRSVAASMVSDVPLGAFLSGGIDSSMIVALMCKHATGAVKTFTIGFEEDSISEAVEARKVASHLGVDHTEQTVTSSEALDVIPKLADMYDEPFGDSSQIPTHLVSAIARRSVTVSLSGDAGDELFGGYNRYSLAGEMWSKASRIPRPLRNGAGRAIHRIAPPTWDRMGQSVAFGPLKQYKMGVGDRAHKLGDLLRTRDRDDLYRELISHWTEDVVLGVPRPAPGRLAAGFGFTEQMMLRDTTAYLPDDILVKVDRAAMAASLETRVPLLDPDVYRLAWSLPMEYKAKPGRGKIVLRELLGRYVPSALFERPKMGFAIPLPLWLRGPLREWGEELLNPATLRDQGFFDAELVARRWAEHQSGERNWHYRLWDVITFQAWLARWG